MLDIANKLRAIGTDVAEFAADEIERAARWRDEDTVLIGKLGAEVARLRNCCWSWRVVAETLEAALRLSMPIMDEREHHELHAEALRMIEEVRSEG